MTAANILKKQRGAISILGAASIALSLYGFDQVLQYGNAKILDRELDNYARTAAQVALRSELALTKAGIESGSMDPQQTDRTINSLLAQVEMHLEASDDHDVNLKKKITFGNFADDSICNSSDPEVRKGCFIPLSSDASNPRAAETPPDFSAVSVQLWSTDSFYTFTPQGRATYGLEASEQDSDSGCYCKNRYTACLDMDLTTAELAPIPATEAAAIAVKGSDARKNYCNYGYTDTRVSDLTETKYPWAEFDDGWIGRTPDTANLFMFFTQGYDNASFSKVLEHKPLALVDGEDPLYQTGGMLATMMGMMFGASDLRFGYEQNQSTYKKGEITPSSDASDFRCKKSFGLANCSDSGWGSSNWKTVLDDSFYVGYQATCIPGTSSANLAMSRCLAYNDGATPRYESCLEIERRSTMSMNFFERMMAFFMGPMLNWERSYEGLNCEMKQMKYKGWLFWGGWEEV